MNKHLLFFKNKRINERDALGIIKQIVTGSDTKYKAKVGFVQAAAVMVIGIFTRVLAY